MIEKQCKQCGKLMAFRKRENVVHFCSRKCYLTYRKCTSENSGPDMPMLDKDSITEEGYANLIAAIVHRASADVLGYAPGTPYRASAEEFFLSDHFGALTGLEGEPILRNLQKSYKQRHSKYVCRQVRCVETGTVYESLVRAGEAYKISAGTIKYACKSPENTAAGMHFEYVEG